MRRQNTIDTVLFDFDGTLVFHVPDTSDVISAFCTEIGQPLSAEAERFGRRTRHEYFIDPVIRAQIAGLSSDDFWPHFNRHLLESLNIQGDLDLLTRELTSRFHELELTYHCPEPGYQILSELGARGYRLGLVTNRESVERFYDLLEQLDLQPYFEMVLASGEVGVHKPDPGIFTAALERIEARAEASVYVGDNYWADVLGAQRAGLRPILLDPYRLFPEADCQVLEQLDDLLQLLP
ncbi:MAG: HAD family hydrolase [Anaerolineae bacterium]